MKRIGLFLMIITITTLNFSCSDLFTNPNKFIGEWYVEAAVGNETQNETIIFKETSYSSVSNIIRPGQTVTITTSGTYTYTDKELTIHYQIVNGQSVSKDMIFDYAFKNNSQNLQLGSMNQGRYVLSLYKRK